MATELLLKSHETHQSDMSQARDLEVNHGRSGGAGPADFRVPGKIDWELAVFHRFTHFESEGLSTDLRSDVQCSWPLYCKNCNPKQDLLRFALLPTILAHIEGKGPS